MTRGVNIEELTGEDAVKKFADFNLAKRREIRNGFLLFALDLALAVGAITWAWLTFGRDSGLVNFGMVCWIILLVWQGYKVGRQKRDLAHINEWRTGEPLYRTERHGREQLHLYPPG